MSEPNWSHGTGAALAQQRLQIVAKVRKWVEEDPNQWVTRQDLLYVIGSLLDIKE